MQKQEVHTVTKRSSYVVSTDSPGTAGRIILQHPVNIRDIDASGHHVRAHQDPTAWHTSKKMMYKSPPQNSHIFCICTHKLNFTFLVSESQQRYCCVYVSSCRGCSGWWPFWPTSLELDRNTPHKHRYWRWDDKESCHNRPNRTCHGEKHFPIKETVVMTMSLQSSGSHNTQAKLKATKFFCVPL